MTLVLLNHSVYQAIYALYLTYLVPTYPIFLSGVIVLHMR
jgi:hypothetical protein